MRLRAEAIRPMAIKKMMQKRMVRSCDIRAGESPILRLYLTLAPDMIRATVTARISRRPLARKIKPGEMGMR